MIKRGNLVDKFELVVKQEIINHNRAILANNQVINELQENLSSFKSENKVKLDDINTKILKREAQLSNLSEHLKEIVQELKNVGHNHKKYIDDTEKSLNSFSKNTEAITENTLSLKEEIDSIKNSISKLSSYVHDSLRQNRQDLELYKMRCYEYINTSIAVIESKPCKIELLKKEIERKDQVLGVDFEGLKTEIDIIKKKIFIQEKYIEKLLTDSKKNNSG